MHRPLVPVFLLLAPVAAHAAGPDLVTTLRPPSSVEVYEEATWRATVANEGTRHAHNVLLVLELPVTNTSPTVHVMGELGAMSSCCQAVGLTVEGDLGRVRTGASKTVRVDLALPLASGDLVVRAVASTTSNETDPSDDEDEVVAALDTIDVGLQPPESVTIEHCTGQALTSFFECAASPGSISSHATTLESDGSITFPQPGYTGSWWSDTDDHLAFEYVDPSSITVLEFEGYGVGADCFEGIATFPTNPSWVAAYQVCR